MKDLQKCGDRKLIKRIVLDEIVKEFYFFRTVLFNLELGAECLQIKENLEVDFRD